MGKLIVDGGRRIHGECVVETAKNAVLPIMAACVMIEEPVTLTDVPDIQDVTNMLAILERIGCKVSRDGTSVTIDASGTIKDEIPLDLGETLRSSIFLAGPLLVRCGGVTFGRPGGCDIGKRPINLHEKGLIALGATVTIFGGLVRCEGALRGGDFNLAYPSVGATENVMMAATLTKGNTKIMNAAREPEIIDLAKFLNKCGAKVTGAGESTIYIEGTDRLNGVTYKAMPDRIEAGTLLAAAAATGGELKLMNAPSSDMAAQLDVLRKMGCEVNTTDSTIELKPPQRLTAFGEVTTSPHPGFPTDMQAITFALATLADGSSTINEMIFENRFAHSEELRRMGAHVNVEGSRATIEGTEELTGANVMARDLRAGAALVVAGLAAHGTTVIDQVENIDRGYVRIEEKLTSLGASIRRVEE